MSAAVDRLKASVARLEDAITSTEEFIKGMAQAMRDAAGDQATVIALADELDTRATELTNAITTPPATP
jgi:prefoldin subunit 5